ncbi:hypothetical protein [Corynebacterium accolens]|uniref:hypothetical protein n=1 Tax=Corynebacterium accolens TaxID=38284 RepID=UPI00254E75D5|nr:hypothetical protein [Corynebacterium accolens]MDK8505575.1 hypothetical protein [Corynebacterium accolens]MDK8662425.1 hypothetical protein [Corynebacterium accolens]
MTDPTRQEILDAYSALEELKNVALSAADFCGDTEKFLMWKNEILKALPPKPQPTMAEIEWDDDKHYLAEAERVDGAKVAMLKPMRLYPQIKCLAFDGGDFCIDYPDPDDLIPTGKRYTLTEVQE